MADIRKAASLRVGFCEAGELIVEFLDERERVFAHAVMSRDGFAHFYGCCTEALEAVSLGGLAMMPIGGHA